MPSGLARLSGLFANDVRSRAVPYVQGEAIDVVTSSARLLAAKVTGSDEYLTTYERKGSVLFYGCTCPYFNDREEACKHLWALAVKAMNSEIVRGAATCTRF